MIRSSLCLYLNARLKYLSIRIVLKIASPDTAFYQGGKISEIFMSIDTVKGELTGGKVVSAPGIIIFGTAPAETPMRFPKIEK